MQRVVSTFLLLLITIHSSRTFVINCHYNEWDWNFKQRVYECQGKPAELDESPGHVVNVTGQHMGNGGNHTEVEALRFLHQPLVTFIPNGIGKFFPNLKGLSFLNCNIKTISKDHLAEFPRMMQVAYNYNLLEVIPGDLFIYTPMLQLVNFASNRIKSVGVGFFKPLKNLEYIWFEKNACINMNARKLEFKKLKKELGKSCGMGGKTECSKRIPKAFKPSRNSTISDTCEPFKIYRFKQKPTHELVKMGLEKVEEEEKQRLKYISKVLKICEYGDDIYRFFETVYYEKIDPNAPDYLKKVEKENLEKKINEGLVNISKDKKETKNGMPDLTYKF